MQKASIRRYTAEEKQQLLANLDIEGLYTCSHRIVLLG